MEERSASDICNLVREIWKSVLNRTEIETGENFFELGGDSLTMIDMLFELNKRLTVEIDPGLLFDDATLGGFSALVSDRLAKDLSGVEGVV